MERIARILIFARVGCCSVASAYMICSARARVPSLCRFPIGGNQEFLRDSSADDATCRQGFAARAALTHSLSTHITRAELSPDLRPRPIAARSTRTPGGRGERFCARARRPPPLIFRESDFQGRELVCTSTTSCTVRPERCAFFFCRKRIKADIKVAG